MEKKDVYKLLYQLYFDSYKLRGEEDHFLRYIQLCYRTSLTDEEDIELDIIRYFLRRASFKSRENMRTILKKALKFDMRNAEPEYVERSKRMLVDFERKILD